MNCCLSSLFYSNEYVLLVLCVVKQSKTKSSPMQYHGTQRRLFHHSGDYDDGYSDISDEEEEQEQEMKELLLPVFFFFILESLNWFYFVVTVYEFMG